MNLEGMTRRPRHDVIFDVRENIQGCGGAILDHQQFSNRILSLSIEFSRARFENLLVAIESAGVSLMQTSVNDATDEAAGLAQEAPQTKITGSLVIRFISDEPDLRVPVPAIPG